MITTTDLDLVAYSMIILKKYDYKISETRINDRIAFDIDITNDEKDAYYKSPYRRIKRTIDDLKRVISDKKNTEN